MLVLREKEEKELKVDGTGVVSAGEQLENVVPSAMSVTLTAAWNG